jgi:C1A family cysteine protease
LKVTQAEMKNMEKEVALKAAEERGEFAAGAGFAAPASVDWRNSGHVTEVKNQGPCGSCVAFGTCASIEAMVRVKMKDSGLAIDLSEAFCQFCGGGSCSGWKLASGLEFAKTTGVVDEACMPYRPENMDCESERCSDWESRLTKINSYTGHASAEARKNAIASVGPVVAGMAVYNDFYGYGGGIYEKTHSATLEGYHCICVVGYNDAEGYWIIKNSWGPNWGEGGFCKIAYSQADLLIDTSWPFYSCDPDVVPKKGNGEAKYLLVDKYFGGGSRLWAYAGEEWRYRNITDTELKGIVHELFEADLVHVWWDGPIITLIRGWKNP